MLRFVCSEALRKLFSKPNPSKLAKMPKNIPWYYAVREGKVPGVYHSWPECLSQITGFSTPIFKKFPSKEDALKFVNTAKASDKVLPSNGSSAGCSDSSSSVDSEIKAIKSSMERMENQMEEMVSALAQVTSTVARIEKAVFFSPGSKRALHTTSAVGAEGASVAKQPKIHRGGDRFTGQKFSYESGTHVYTDGGCFDNGKCDAKAGIGVYWGPEDLHNVSERLPGRPTNNRAEIYAALRAVQIAKSKGIVNLILHTDSQFLINGITRWIKSWKTNGWISASGKPVINKDDFEALEKELTGVNVKWVYVQAHSGHPSNDAVDSLAKQGALKPL